MLDESVSPKSWAEYERVVVEAHVEHLSEEEGNFGSTTDIARSLWQFLTSGFVQPRNEKLLAITFRNN